MRVFWIGLSATLLLLCGSVVGLPLDAGAGDEGGCEWGKLPQPLSHSPCRSWSTSASTRLPMMPPPLAFAAGGVGRAGASRARGAHVTRQAGGLLSRMAGTGAVIVAEAAGPEGEGGMECEAAARAWEARGQNSTLEESLGPRHFVKIEGSLQTAGSGPRRPSASSSSAPSSFSEEHSDHGRAASRRDGGRARHRIALAAAGGGLGRVSGSGCLAAYASLGATLAPPSAAQARPGARLSIPTVLRVRGGGSTGRWWWKSSEEEEEEKEKRRQSEAEMMTKAKKILDETQRKPTWWERVRPFRVHKFRNGFALVWNNKESAEQEKKQRQAFARILAAQQHPSAGGGRSRRWWGVGGVWGWVRRLLKVGVGLATMQPLALAVTANLFKVLVILWRIATRGLGDLDFDDIGTKPSLAKDANSTTTFADVVGVDEAKHELEDIVAYLKDPGRFTRLGGKMTKGVLLYGPPGTGKTLLARAVAGEAGVPFKYASGSEFEEKYVGVGAQRVRELFQAARKAAPCIVFIDEIDAIGSTRSLTDQQSLRQTLNQILTELDGFASSEGLIVIGATNFPEVLDKALMRPGRFDRHIEVPNPDVRGREAILRLHSKNVTLGEDADLHVLARGTPGFSGADLANLVNKAACKASKDGAADVKMKDMEFAKDLIMMGAERTGLPVRQENKLLTAYHEGGHALVATFTDGALPVHKATIVPRGHAMGMVMQLPEEDMTSWSRRQMMAEMDVCMGGRAAEELIFGIHNITSGASSDLERATQVAVNMVEKLGMSVRIGFVSHGGGGRKSRYNDGGGGNPSEETRAAIDQEVRKLAEESYTRAKRLLSSHMGELHALAEALMDRETLTGEEVREVFAAERQRSGGWLWKRLLGVRGRGAWGKKETMMTELDGRMKSLEMQVGELGTVASSLGEIRKALDTIKEVLPKKEAKQEREGDSSPPAA